jgi:ribonuclease P protein component
MVLWLLSREDSRLRLGVVAGKRTFRKAVERARAKRLLREAYRLNRFRCRGTCDVVLVGRRAILGVSVREVEEELLALAGKAGLLGEDA